MPDGPLVAKIGTIVKEDPSLRFSKDSKPYAKFNLQVKPYVPKGQEQVEPVYYEVTCFGSLAEHVAESMRKGYRVGVIGIGKVETWEKDGKTNSKKVILADFVGPDLRFVNATLSDGKSEPATPAPIEYGEDEEPF